jgi:hypothetical protein
MINPSAKNGVTNEGVMGEVGLRQPRRFCCWRSALSLSSVQPAIQGYGALVSRGR